MSSPHLSDRTRYPFFMVPNAVFDLPLSHWALAVYLNLRRRANNPGGAAFPSLELVAKDVKFSRRTVQSGLKELLDGGYVKLIAGGQTTGRIGVYEIIDLEAVSRPHGADQPERSGGEPADPPEPEDRAGGVGTACAGVGTPRAGGRHRVRTEEEEPKNTTQEDTTAPSSAAAEPPAPKVIEPEIVEALPCLKANDVLREYSDGFHRKFGERPIMTGQDAGAAKQLARRLTGGLPVIQRAVTRFFNASTGWWVEKNAYTFNVFISCYNQALAGQNGNAGDARTQRLRETARNSLADHGIVLGENELSCDG